VDYTHRDLFGFGWNRFGQLGDRLRIGEAVVEPCRLIELDALDADEESVLKVVCGCRSTCVLTTKGRVFIFGQLGLDLASLPFDDATSSSDNKEDASLIGSLRFRELRVSELVGKQDKQQHRATQVSISAIDGAISVVVVAHDV